MGIAPCLFGATALTLDPDLQWTDEHQWHPVGRRLGAL